MSILAVLAAVAVPMMASVREKAEVAAFVTEAAGAQKAVEAWVRDIKTLLPLAANGTVNTAADTAFETQLRVAGGTALKWADWNGPYLSVLGVPAFATGISIYNVASAGAYQNFDLDGNGTGDMANMRVVYLAVTGVSAGMWAAIDRDLDKAVTGTEAQRQARGRVTYNSGTGDLYVYLAHR